MSFLNNVHKMASKVIPTRVIEWGEQGKSSTDQYGCRNEGTVTWRTVKAHVQPGIISSFGGKNIDEKDYKDFGLDFSHRHITIWIDGTNIHTVAEKDSPDKVRFDEMVFNVMHTADWLDFDGWKRCYCEEVLG